MHPTNTVTQKNTGNEKVKYGRNKETASSEKILEASRRQNSATPSWVLSPIKILLVQSWEARRDSLNFLDIDVIHSFSILSDDRSKASSKTIPPHSAI